MGISGGASVFAGSFAMAMAGTDSAARRKIRIIVEVRLRKQPARSSLKKHERVKGIEEFNKNSKQATSRGNPHFPDTFLTKSPTQNTISLPLRQKDPAAVCFGDGGVGKGKEHNQGRDSRHTPWL